MASRIVMIRSHYPDTRLEKEANVLVENSLEVTLVVWDRGRIKGLEGPKRYSVKKFNRFVQPNSIKVLWYLPIWWCFIACYLIRMKWDLVHAADFDTFLPAVIIAKIRRKPIIYDIYDFYSDMIVFPIMPNFFRLLFGIIDKTLIRFADAIILPDESRREQIGKSLTERAIIIANTPSQEALDKIRVNNKDNKDNDEFTIFYGGCIDKDREIDHLCYAIEDISDTKLIIMGPCPQNYSQQLHKLCKDRHKYELCLSWKPYTDILEQTANADITFAFYNPKSYNNRYASPNKLFEAMMCGRPIITNEGTSMAKIVKSEKCGIVVPFGNIEALKEAIVSLKDDPRLRHNLGNNGRSAYALKYSWTIMKTKLIGIYRELLALP